MDIILNSLTGTRLQASWNCLAPLGRFIELGQAGRSAEQAPWDWAIQPGRSLYSDASRAMGSP